MFAHIIPLAAAAGTPIPGFVESPHLQKLTHPASEFAVQFASRTCGRQAKDITYNPNYAGGNSVPWWKLIVPAKRQAPTAVKHQGKLTRPERQDTPGVVGNLPRASPSIENCLRIQALASNRGVDG